MFTLFKNTIPKVNVCYKYSHDIFQEDCPSHRACYLSEVNVS